MTTNDPPLVFWGEVPTSELQAVASAGVDCISVPTAAAALAQLQSISAFILLVDERSAWKDDGQDYAWLAARRPSPEVPMVLVASADSPAELIETCARAGLDDCILRPLSPEQLKDRKQALAAPPARLPALPARRAPRKVVLAGEDFEYRKELADLLEHSGYHVLNDPPQESGEPLDLSRVGSFDLLLIAADLASLSAARQLGGLLRQAHQGRRGAQVPVLVISSGAPLSPGTGLGAEVVERALPAPKLLARIDSLLARAAYDLRAHRRVPFYCPVEFREAGGTKPKPWCSGYTLALSAAGIFVRTLLPVRAGAAVELRIQVTLTREQLCFTGVVVWGNPHAGPQPFAYPVGMGIEFLGVRSQQLTRLVELCRGEPSFS